MNPRYQPQTQQQRHQQQYYQYQQQQQQQQQVRPQQQYQQAQYRQHQAQPQARLQQQPQNPDAAKRMYLHQQGWPTGLINVVMQQAHRFPLRFWIMDNSSSMQTQDAHVVSGSTIMGLQRSNCTRWHEAQSSMMNFSHLAATLHLPTRFSMLNDLGSMFGPPNFSVGEQGPHKIAEDMQKAQAIIQRAYPSGATPLAQHLAAIRNVVVQVADSVRAGQRILPIIIATDGIPSDKDGNEGYIIQDQFRTTLRSFAGLPVWIVIRLCTDDDSVFDFYHSLNSMQLNISVDVLDDYFGEALEVYLQNPWLTYPLPIHRIREIGFYVPPFDQLDDRPLSFTQLHQLFSVIFEHGSTLPNPQYDWVGFLRGTARLLTREQHYFNPVLRTRTPLVDIRRLHATYGRGMKLPHDLQSIPHFPEPPKTRAPVVNKPVGPAQGTKWPSAMGGSLRTNPNAIPKPQSATRSTSMPNQPFGQSNASGGNSSNGTSNTTNGSNAQSQQPYVPSNSSSSPSDNTALKYSILRWAVASNQLRPIDQLLSSLQQTFPPAFGTPTHAYFQKWRPISHEVLKQRSAPVIKRAFRKAKFFLHPDKLPRDMSKDHLFLCKMLWDILADAWEMFDA